MVSLHILVICFAFSSNYDLGSINTVFKHCEIVRLSVRLDWVIYQYVSILINKIIIYVLERPFTMGQIYNHII